MKDKIYIAGPMSGYEGYNFDAFNQAEEDIGHHTQYRVVNPAGKDDLDKDGNPTQTKEEFIRRDLKKLTDCDAIALLDGWKCSSGAQTELRAALEMGLEVYYWNDVKKSLKPVENPETVLREGESQITGKKMVQYGSPEKSFDKIAGMWNSLFGEKIEKGLTAEDVALAMVCVKCVREENDHKRDNLVDIAGYAGTIELIRYMRD